LFAVFALFSCSRDRAAAGFFQVILAISRWRLPVERSVSVHRTVGFEVGAGHSTLADSWITRSSRRFKTNIQPLVGALKTIEQLQGVSYERKSDGKREIGVVAEDVDQVVPELVARDPLTKEAQGVDYARLSALLIEAVKTQQDEIQQLKAQVLQVKSNRHAK
jgi:Chaperone of endosialidase